MVGEIGPGLLLFLGVGRDDTAEDVDYLVEKVLHLRIFADDQSRFNLSLLDIRGSVLVVSQFTLLGTAGKDGGLLFPGPPRPKSRRTSLPAASSKRPSEAGLTVASGRFQEMMEVHLINDGPVTLLLDSQKTF